jgi:hypothetical protein
MRLKPETLEIISAFIKNHLHEREAFVVEQRFGLSGPPKTLQYIGEKLLGITRERVRQLEVRALKNLAAAAANSNINEAFFLNHPGLLKKIKKLVEEKREFEAIFFHKSHQSPAISLNRVPVEWLQLSPITLNCLHQKAGITFVGDLTKKSEKDLLYFRGLGIKKLAEIKKALRRKGLKLKSNISNETIL